MGLLFMHAHVVHPAMLADNANVFSRLVSSHLAESQGQMLLKICGHPSEKLTCWA